MTDVSVKVDTFMAKFHWLVVSQNLISLHESEIVGRCVG